jgi:hypothetical protein
MLLLNTSFLAKILGTLYVFSKLLKKGRGKGKKIRI